jgi:hypothetical protein
MGQDPGSDCSPWRAWSGLAAASSWRSLPGGVTRLCPCWFRLIALLGGVSGSDLDGTRLLRARERPRQRPFLARSIEPVRPSQSGLITYVQLSSDGYSRRRFGKPSESGSPRTWEVRPEIVVPAQDARRKAFCLGGALAALLVLAAISPSGFWLSFRRSLMPIRNLTETQIARVHPGNSVAYKGKDVEIAVELTGKIPPFTQLWVTRSSSEPVKYELPRRQDGSYRCILPGVTESFSYWVTANDATSDDYRIRISEVPRLRSLAATLHFPKYTGFPPRSQDSGNIDAIEGTSVTLEGTATRPLQSATLVLKDRRLPSSDVRGDRFSFRFTVEESLDYAIEMTDRDGTADPEPSKGRVVARKDAAPQVAIRSPARTSRLRARSGAARAASTTSASRCSR